MFEILDRLNKDDVIVISRYVISVMINDNESVIKSTKLSKGQLKNAKALISSISNFYGEACIEEGIIVLNDYVKNRIDEVKTSQREKSLIDELFL